MRLPNGYGSVYKLSGKRRNPYVVKKVVGWKCDDETMRANPIYEYIGYYPTKKEALQALADYNENPYDLNFKKLTFKDIYDRWSEEHFKKIKNPNGYEAAYNTCKPLHNMIFREIKLDHLQKVMDESGKNSPTLKTMKNMFGLMWDFAVIHEIVPKDKRDLIGYLDIGKAGNPNKRDRKPFTRADIQKLWDAEKTDPYISTVLMLIYTGVRISELLDLKKDNVHLSERWFFVAASKTSAGVREVPIAEKIVPFFEYWMSRGGEYLLSTAEKDHVTYRNYYDTYWEPVMEKFQFSFTPHCTRHTCVSLMTEAGVDERILKKIVGHKGQNVTEDVYTHIELPYKLEAINKI